MQNSQEEILNETNPEIRFLNFTPNRDLEREIWKQLQKIESQSPGHSTLKLYFHKQNNLFGGSLSIHSYYVSFFSSASGKELSQVMEKIFKDVQNQIEKWRRKRSFNVISSGKKTTSQFQTHP